MSMTPYTCLLVFAIEQGLEDQFSIFLVGNRESETSITVWLFDFPLTRQKIRIQIELSFSLGCLVASRSY